MFIPSKWYDNPDGSHDLRLRFDMFCNLMIPCDFQCFFEGGLARPSWQESLRSQREKQLLEQELFELRLQHLTKGMGALNPRSKASGWGEAVWGNDAWCIHMLVSRFAVHIGNWWMGREATEHTFWWNVTNRFGIPTMFGKKNESFCWDRLWISSSNYSNPTY